MTDRQILVDRFLLSCSTESRMEDPETLNRPLTDNERFNLFGKRDSEEKLPEYLAKLEAAGVPYELAADVLSGVYHLALNECGL